MDSLFAFFTVPEKVHHEGVKLQISDTFSSLVKPF